MRYVIVDPVNGCRIGPAYSSLEVAAENWQPGNAIKRMPADSGTRSPAYEALSDSELNQALCAIMHRAKRGWDL